MTNQKLAINGGESAVRTPKPHDELPNTIDEEIEAVRDYLESGGQKAIYGHSELLQNFENRFLDYHDMEYAVVQSSGTSALNSAFFAVGLEPGDEVIAPTYTFLATVMPIFQQRGYPVLADAKTDTGNIDPESVREQVSDRTEAIVVTHMWGHPVDMDSILEIAEEHDLAVIEDCSHAHGATYNGQLVGTFGDVSCFSLGSTKLVSGGECGIMMTNNEEMYERATMLGHFRNRSFDAVETDYYEQFTDVGYGQNYRAHPLGVVMADKQFDYLDEWIEERNQKLDYLTEKLEDVPGIEPPTTHDNVHRGAYYGYKPAFVSEDFNDDISVHEYIDALQSEGMKVKKPGSKPLHTLEFFQTYDDGYFGRHHDNERWKSLKHIYEDGDLPRAEQYYRPRLSLPTFHGKGFDLVDEYIDGFRKVAENWEKR
ncbi:DegT/DnrJ/EryC1/StrS family aminotransferase [Haladaptatus cibarius]|uniref:DegT/DnrJ/EryC1/StrS family aminotransferase n=1 Tax=Haladaptatus cibarius TaxID=453847 RepID=UPI000678890B|nr:DegT/DnrJ/EryC1/StrS family aminotransferase [Haladaptatus cibarius]